MKRPDIDSTKEECLKFVGHWINLCAEGKTEEAFSYLDNSKDDLKKGWTYEKLKDKIFGAIDEEKAPKITSVDTAKGDLYKKVYEYNKCKSFGVVHNLPLNNASSDFKLIFDFVRSKNEMKIFLLNCVEE